MKLNTLKSDLEKLPQEEISELTSSCGAFSSAPMKTIGTPRHAGPF